MHRFRFSFIVIVLFVFLIQTINTKTIFSQDIDLTTADTTIIDPETFDLSEVSRKSAELTLKAKEIVSLTNDKEEIERMKQENEKVIHFIDSLLMRESYVKVSSLSSRNLNSKLIYWQQNLQIVKDQQTDLSDRFKLLNESAKYLGSELELWIKTDEMVQGDELAGAVHKHFTDIKIMIDTTKNVLDQKSAHILNLLDIITRLEVEIESLVTKIEHVILAKQESIFITDQPSLFSLNYGNKNNWVIHESYLKYYSGNYIYFKDYLGKHLGLLIFHIILMIGFIILFIKLNRLNFKIVKGEGSFYVKRLKVLISNPISVALVLSLFLSVFIYPYRPIMFLDISRILVIIPIVIVLTNILGRKYRPYAFAFGFLFILYVVFLNVPVNHLLARMILLIVTIVLILTFTHFLFRIKKANNLKISEFRFFIYTTYLLLTMSAFGFLANLIGKVPFSTYMVEAVLGILLVGIIISFLLVVVNGLVVLFIDSKYGDQLNIIKHNKTASKKKFTKFFNVVAILLLIYFVLDIFKIQGNIVDWLTDFFLKERNLGSVVFTWGNISVFFIVIYLSIVIAGFIRTLLEEDVLNKMNMKKGVPYTIALMVKYTLVTAGIFLAVSAAGIPTTSLTVIIGAFGVGIGFGLQNIFNNLVSGLILLFERPIQIGDTIEVGALMGNVRSIGIRSSNVRTFDGAEIIVPNGNLISNEVINWTLSDDRRRVEIIVGVSYDSDPHQVRKVLVDIIKDHPDIEQDPKPTVQFKNLGESSLDFRMLFWTREFDQWIRLKSDILFEVFDQLKKAGIEIPFPQRDLHLRSVDKEIDFQKSRKETTTDK